MFTREEAKARLASARIADWADVQEARLAGLPKALRRPAAAVFNRRNYLLTGAYQQGIEKWPELAADQRRVIFEAAAPGHSGALERAWQLCDRLPYQTGSLRRPFRVVDRPEVDVLRRAQAVRGAASALGAYQGDLLWFAAWSAHFHGIGELLAAEIDHGPHGDEVLATLLEIVGGTHPFGTVSHSSIRALLMCDRVEAWEAVEQLLLAAQRQEGIRQVVFESVDESHPEAFRRMLRLTADEKLTRFAAVVRAYGVWSGLQADVTDRQEVDRMLALITEAYSARRAADAAIASGDPRTVYAGLWSMAANDASAAAATAERLVADAPPEVRFAATHLLAQLGLPESRRVLRGLLSHHDTAIAARACRGLLSGPAESGTYEDLEGYLDRLEKPRTITAPVWDWLELEESPSRVIVRLLNLRDDRHPVELHRHLQKMDASARSRYVSELSRVEQTPESRRALVQLASDRSQWVSAKAFEVLATTGITAEEAPAFEALLTRKTGATRSAAISMLASLPDAAALESASRLMESGKVAQRLGGLDLLRQLAEANRSAAAITDSVQRYGQRPRLSEAEQTALAALATGEVREATLEDGLGLFDPAELSQPVPPRRRKLKVSTTGYRKLLQAADQLVDQYRETPLGVEDGFGTEERLYGNQRWGLDPKPGADPLGAPLGDAWRDWWERQRPGEHDLERCLVSAEPFEWEHHQAIAAKGLPKPFELGYRSQVDSALWWLWLAHGGAAGIDFLLAGYENALAMVPPRELADPIIARRAYSSRDLDWRDHSPILNWRRALNKALALRRDLFTRDAITQMWKLVVWLDRPDPAAPRHRPSLDLLLTARSLGLATDADLMDDLIGDRSLGGRFSSRRWDFRSLAEATRRKVPEALRPFPEMVAAASRARERIIEVELQRGDVATPASAPALALRSVPGAHQAVALLKALGRSSFQRGWTWNSEQKKSVLSHLIRVSHPAEKDTPADFAARAAAAGLSERRFLELALYAPQWSRHVAHAVSWDGLEDAVFWLHAHTKDTRWSVDSDVRDEWAAEIASRTPLSAADLVDGGVDVEWFHRVLAMLGEERWQQLLGYAKYTSGGGGHKRAEMFGEALRGALDIDALMTRIRDKRHQDSVRALGLVPLATDSAGKEKEVLRRYQLFQEFRQGSHKFGSQRQASERRAVEIGLDNLARTAGYADPVRLQWQMETLEAADLAAGPVVLEKGEYTFELAIDDLGQAAVTTAKNGRQLKSVPAKLRKDDQVVSLRDRAKVLRRQVSRVRTALEMAAVTGDAFTGLELQRLHHHPVLRPMLHATLFALPDGGLGLPVDGGAALVGVDGAVREIDSHPVRVAHPVDLLASDEWSQWQHRCFVDEIKQPFKQVFRELYVLTAAETKDGKKSLRYAGHQLNPRQAAGLFSSRGWISHPDGYTFKTFHRQGLVATVFFEGALFTPAEVDGATMYGLTFQRRDELELVDLDGVPPRLFSEVMRDLDLVVSVAHIGGVDPEASASTVEMRQALVRETATLLSLDNVRFSGSHVIVEGTRGSYSIHLGSAQVHRQPGGAVCLIPVGSQHRGRLFLPFADDDPKTAEVVAKTVLLARDDQIKDPTILEQII